ncbi:hypothetical protein HMPREF1148_1290 [Selenomonas sp. FOBRC6]|uniref:hypothetical protein n=1 Tax=Selenomonas sp. FOBRC6 TaxID=936572 RepID=UPI000278285B|nr:hypothetical protein [Selenomonas sp. FOBRC6]EJO23386.1 hypothetical protein HMPREF1148_1290 [Selenomonas sp. FOBRC6]
MELEKIFGSRAITANAPAKTKASKTEAVDETFSRMLQNLKESKSADAREREEGDTVITRVLADGSVVTQIYQGNKLIAQTMTRGAHPERGKAVITERIEKLKPNTLEESADPLLASKAAQASVATAGLVSAML